MCDRGGFVFVEAGFGDPFCEEGAVGPAGDVVAGWDRQEGAGVFVESDGVVEPGAVEGVFAGVGALVEGEQDQTETGRCATLAFRRRTTGCWISALRGCRSAGQPPVRRACAD